MTKTNDKEEKAIEAIGDVLNEIASVVGNSVLVHHLTGNSPKTKTTEEYTKNILALPEVKEYFKETDSNA